MENINLNNYEAFFLDYLEGNLSAQQEFELIDFLDKYPDLKAELDIDLDGISLYPEELSMDLSSLKKQGVQADEVDDLMIASVEGMLSYREEIQLSNYVVANNLQQKLKFYQKSILSPDLSEIYSNKRQLKKRDRLAPIFYAVIVAAAMTATIWGVYNNPSNEEEYTSPIAFVGTNEIQIQPKPFTYQSTEKDFSPIANTADIQHELLHEVSDNTLGDKKDELTGNNVASNEQNFNVKENISSESINPIDEDNGANEAEIIDKEIEDLDLKKAEEKILDRPSYNKKKKDQALIITEEPIKVITNIAGNIFNQEVSYKRDRNTKSDQLVSHHVKIGRFEFQRNKH